MDKKFIPYDKMNKKQRKEIDKQRRGDWGNVKPATIAFENEGKAIPKRRNKRKRDNYYDDED